MCIRDSIRSFACKRFARSEFCDSLGSFDTVFVIEIDFYFLFFIICVVLHVIAAAEREEPTRSIPRDIQSPADFFARAFARGNYGFKRARLCFGYDRLIVIHKVAVIGSVRIAVYLFFFRSPAERARFDRFFAVFSLYFIEIRSAYSRQRADAEKWDKLVVGIAIYVRRGGRVFAYVAVSHIFFADAYFNIVLFIGVCFFEFFRHFCEGFLLGGGAPQGEFDCVAVASAVTSG